MPVLATYLIKEQMVLANVDREIFHEAFECQPCIFVFHQELHNAGARSLARNLVGDL
jgi:hypothetical protein